VFLAHKIQRQLQLIQQGGYLISHTSYYVSYPEQGDALGLMRSGRLSGKLHPAIIAGCPIAMPTVMIHRAVILGGFEFPTNIDLGEDVLAWIELSVRHEMLGIDEPLSIVEWSTTSAALNYERGILGIMNMLESLRESPVHRREVQHIAKLELSLRQIARQWRTGCPPPAQVAAFRAVEAGA